MAKVGVPARPWVVIDSQASRGAALAEVRSRPTGAFETRDSTGPLRGAEVVVLVEPAHARLVFASRGAFVDATGAADVVVALKDITVGASHLAAVARPARA